MCTVSWIHTGGGYELFCNRDEKRSRAVADPPLLIERGGVRMAAPRDGESGGSWIAVNEFGLTVCLLNGANVTAGAAIANLAVRSRGEVVMCAAVAVSPREAAGIIRRLDAGAFAPFTVVALAPSLPATVIEWNGAAVREISPADELMPLVSSSFDADRVRARRRWEFARVTYDLGGVTREALRRFHGSHLEHASAHSPCMHRPDAMTVSCSRIAVSHDSVEFEYQPCAPCEGKARRSLRFARAPRGVAPCIANWQLLPWEHSPAKI